MPASSFNTGQVNVVAGTATLIVGPNRGRHAVLVTNLGTNQVYIGATPNVTTLTGTLLPGSVGASISIPTAGPVYGIAVGSNQAVSFMDI